MEEQQDPIYWLKKYEFALDLSAANIPKEVIACYDSKDTGAVSIVTGRHQNRSADPWPPSRVVAVGLEALANGCPPEQVDQWCMNNYGVTFGSYYLGYTIMQMMAAY